MDTAFPARMFRWAAILEKLVFAVPALVAFALGRTEAVVAGFAAIDVLLASGFLRARRLTPIEA